jgi:Domain of unknown function (DUF4136)
MALPPCRLPRRPDVASSIGPQAFAIALALSVSLTASDRRVQTDPHFDFHSVRTWAWDASGAGDVRMARSAEDDPEAVRRRVEPVIMTAVAQELGRRGLRATTDAPDMRVHYYVLITVGVSTQEMGQFLPSIAQWNVPPFAPEATSYDIVQTGSLVLDAVSSTLGRVVWRGIAQGDLDKIRDDADRDARIRKAVHDLMARLPVKA